MNKQNTTDVFKLHSDRNKQTICFIIAVKDNLTFNKIPSRNCLKVNTETRKCDQPTASKRSISQTCAEFQLASLSLLLDGKKLHHDCVNVFHERDTRISFICRQRELCFEDSLPGFRRVSHFTQNTFQTMPRSPLFCYNEST